MTDFSNLKRYHLTDETTAEYVFGEIEGAPSIIFAPAEDSNKAFQSERLRLQIEDTKRLMEEPRGKSEDATPDTMAAEIEESRERDRVLLSRTCARGWGVPPVDTAGDTPAFSAETCYDFFRALPNDMFDPVRGFVQNLRNFRRVSKKGVEQLGN